MPRQDETRSQINYLDDLKPLYFSVAVSVVVVTAFIYLAGTKDLLAQPINEIGDAVAGFASILAFLWLITTIVLQYREIRAQRIDLQIMIESQDEQNKELTASRKVAEDELKLLRQNQGVLFEDYTKRRSESAVHDLLALIIFDTLPTLAKSGTFARYFDLDSEQLAIARTLLDGRRYTESLLALGNFLYAGYVHKDETENIFQELSQIDFVRERLDSLSTTIVCYNIAKHVAGSKHEVAMDIGFYLISKSLNWLLVAKDRFEPATDIFLRNLNNAIQDLDQITRDDGTSNQLEDRQS